MQSSLERDFLLTYSRKKIDLAYRSFYSLFEYFFYYKDIFTDKIFKDFSRFLERNRVFIFVSKYNRLKIKLYFRLSIKANSYYIHANNI